MIVTLITTADATRRERAEEHLRFRLPVRVAPYNFDEVLDAVDAASTPSGRYILLRDENLRLTTALDRAHLVAIVMPDDVPSDVDHPLDATIEGPAVHRRDTAPKVHPAL